MFYLKQSILFVFVIFCYVGGPLGTYCVRKGVFFVIWGPILTNSGDLGPFFGNPGAHFALFWALGVHIGPIGVDLGLYVAASWPFCAFLGSFWAYFGSLLGGAFWHHF